MAIIINQITWEFPPCNAENSIGERDMVHTHTTHNGIAQDIAQASITFQENCLRYMS